VFVRISGKVHYLSRAVDHEGEVLEVFATKRRDRMAVLKFLKRAMRWQANHDRWPVHFVSSQLNTGINLLL